MTREARAWAVADAQDCMSGDAPSAYDSESCDITANGITFFVCGRNAYDRLECDLDSGQSAQGNATVVADYAATTGFYSAWGEVWDSSGSGAWVKFCCIEEVEIEEVVLWGTAGADNLKFSYVPTSDSLHHTSGGVLEAVIEGQDGDDYCQGSDDTAGINEYLEGQGGADTLRGRGGNDWACGDECSGANAVMGRGTASLSDTSTNGVNGGPGDDVMVGATGPDYLCDLGGTDIFTGHDGNDHLYAGPTDSPSGDPGAGANTCGHTSLGTWWSGGTCTLSLTSAPSSCPAY